MKITLLINEEEKTFGVEFVKARMFRRALEMSTKMDFNNLTAESLDDLIQFVCDLYNKQFTIDELYDGLHASKLMPTLTQAMEYVVGSAGSDSDKGKLKLHQKKQEVS